MTYHNTLPVDGEELDKRKELTSAQDNAVLDAALALHFFRTDFTSETILNRLQVTDENGKWASVPLTSIRRSVNTLIKRGYFEYVLKEDGKHDTTIGGYGHRVRLLKLCH